MMNFTDFIRAPIWPSYTTGPRHFSLPLTPPPASPGRRYVPPPVACAWGVGGDIRGVVQRDKEGVCLSLSVHINGDRERFDVERIPPNVARELATRLVQQADAWDREFGAEVQP